MGQYDRVSPGLHSPTRIPQGNVVIENHLSQLGSIEEGTRTHSLWKAFARYTDLTRGLPQIESHPSSEDISIPHLSKDYVGEILVGPSVSPDLEAES